MTHALTRRVIALTVVLVVLQHEASAQTISGPVRVIDGDTIVLTNTNTHVRLNGVDAPEVEHPGYDHDDPLGPESRAEMRRIVGNNEVRCELNGERSYERVVGVCFLPGWHGHWRGDYPARRGAGLRTLVVRTLPVVRARRGAADHPRSAILLTGVLGSATQDSYPEGNSNARALGCHHSQRFPNHPTGPFSEIPSLC